MVKPSERQIRHAANQEKYHRKKMETHKKICIWVPKSSVSPFLKSVERMQKKWS